MQQPVVHPHPERRAWVVLWTSFAVFCLLVILMPLGIRSFLLYSTVAHAPVLRTVEGTAVVDNPATGSEMAIGRDDARSVGEGSVISLDDKSRAVLTFFDGSAVHILPSTLLSIDAVRGPRFAMGVRPVTISLRIVSGAVKVVATDPLEHKGLDFVLRCPLLGAEIAIRGDGVYGAEVESGSADVFANRGEVTVTANGKSVQLVAPERTTVKAGQPPLAPVADARELIRNGDLRQPLEQDWTVINDQGSDGPSVDGTAVLVNIDGAPAVRLYRTGSGHNHCETKIEQKLDRDLPDPVSSLVVRANIRLISQELSGGGYMGSEFPLIIRVRYRDMYGSENEWVQGFYCENPDNNPTGTGQWLPKDTWQLYESPNLLETLNPTPFRIVSVSVSASGWDYESQVRWISLAVK